MDVLWNFIGSLVEDQDQAAIEILNILHTNGYCRVNYDDFMSNLLQCQTDDPWENYLFGTHPVPRPAIRVAGSTSEGLSIGYSYAGMNGLLTEMDFMFIFGRASPTGPLIIEATTDPGFYTVKIRSPKTTSTRFLHCLCEERSEAFYLSPRKVVGYIEQLVRRVFVNCKIKSQNSDDINCPVTTIKFEQLQRQHISAVVQQDLMVDIAPVLETDMTTSDFNMPCLTRYQRKQVSMQPILLVAKSNSDSLEWRGSTSLAERELFRGITYKDRIADVLMLAKLVKILHVSAESKLTSYHLKTVLLHRLSEIQEREDTNWNYKQIPSHVVDLFTRLNDYLKAEFMPNFFIPAINLLADVDKNSVKQQINEQLHDTDAFRQEVYMMTHSLSYSRLLSDDHGGDFVPVESGDSNTLNRTKMSLIVDDSSPIQILHYEQLEHYLPMLISRLDPEGRSPKDDADAGACLVMASAIGNLEEMERLMTRADVNYYLQDGTTSMYLASQYGQVEAVKLLLARGADVNLSRNDETPLHVAVTKDNLPLANLLVHAGANVNAQLADGRTAILLAVFNGSADMVSLLLQCNADITLCGEDTCIHIACLYGDTQILELLVRYGAGINTRRSRDGATGLHIAASYGNVEAVCWLLDHGADTEQSADVDHQTPIATAIAAINRRIDKEGVDCREAYDQAYQIVVLLLEKGATVNVQQGEASPLLAAADTGHYSLEELLIRHGADVNFPNLDGRTPLILSALNGDLKTVELLTRNGADIDKYDENGNTALFMASVNGHHEVVDFLATKGADVNRQAMNSDYPLTRASRDKHHLTVVKVLLEHAACVNVRDGLGYTALIQAAKYGYLEMAQMLIKNHADVNVVCNEGMTALQHASYNGQLQVVELLLAHAASVDTQNPIDGNTVLHYAVLSGNFDIVSLLAKSNANVNLTQPDGTSCLHLACIYGHRDMVRVLLQCGANVNFPRMRDAKATSLHIAADKGHLSVVKLLLEYQGGDAIVENRVNVDQRTSEGLTALHYAVQAGHRAVAELLLNSGASVDLRDEDGNTALLVAAEHGRTECVSLLLSYNAEIDCANEFNNTPLMFAVSEGHPDLVRLLCDKGADRTVTTDTGHTLLMVAAYKGHTDVVKALLEYEVQIDELDEDELGAIQIAASLGNVEIVHLLLSYGANVNYSQVGETTPLFAAAQIGHARIVEMLLAAGACVDVPLEANGKTALQQAAFSGWLGVVEILLKYKADVNRVQHDGTSSLHSAAFKGRLDIATVLLENGAHVNWQRTSDGGTALHLAAHEGHVELVQHLLDNRYSDTAVVDIRMKDGATPLYVASQNGRNDVVSLLLERGADANAARYDRATPLGIAAQNGHHQCVLQLLRGGADVNDEDQDGDSPLIAAAYGGHKKTALLLLEHGARADHRNKTGHTALSMAASQGHMAVVKCLSH